MVRPITEIFQFVVPTSVLVRLLIVMMMYSCLKFSKNWLSSPKLQLRNMEELHVDKVIKFKLQEKTIIPNAYIASVFSCCTVVCLYVIPQNCCKWSFNWDNKPMLNSFFLYHLKIRISYFASSWFFQIFLYALFLKKRLKAIQWYIYIYTYIICIYIEKLKRVDVEIS